MRNSTARAVTALPSGTAPVKSAQEWRSIYGRRELQDALCTLAEQQEFKVTRGGTFPEIYCTQSQFNRLEKAARESLIKVVPATTAEPVAVAQAPAIDAAPEQLELSLYDPAEDAARDEWAHGLLLAEVTIDELELEEAELREAAQAMEHERGDAETVFEMRGEADGCQRLRQQLMNVYGAELASEEIYADRNSWFAPDSPAHKLVFRGNASAAGSSIIGRIDSNFAGIERGRLDDFQKVCVRGGQLLPYWGELPEGPNRNCCGRHRKAVAHHILSRVLELHPPTTGDAATMVDRLFRPFANRYLSTLPTVMELTGSEVLTWIATND